MWSELPNHRETLKHAITVMAIFISQIISFSSRSGDHFYPKRDLNGSSASWEEKRQNLAWPALALNSRPCLLDIMPEGLLGEKT
ncbi:hypothetical protein [Aeromonas molluscorum]|jgi:hypothetical protein|uniref:hypothetical protein n=1 Tax=Aeromonas molluscorum TaxID=271417 RepID=UPI001267DBE6|nr:hypothetical protein [Aeromonas molluscorum]